MLNNKAINSREKVLFSTPSDSVCIIEAKQHGGISRGGSVGFNAGNVLHGNVLLNVLMTDANQQQPRPAHPRLQPTQRFLAAMHDHR